MTREQKIEEAARDLIRAYGYSVTPGDPMRPNEYEALQALRKACGFPRGVLPASREDETTDEECDCDEGYGPDEECPKCHGTGRSPTSGEVG